MEDSGSAADHTNPYYVVVQDSEDHVQDDGFTAILSKSQKKNMRQKKKNPVKADYNIRSKTGSQSISF